MKPQLDPAVEFYIEALKAFAKQHWREYVIDETQERIKEAEKEYNKLFKID